jgi:hypothetical protein
MGVVPGILPLPGGWKELRSLLDDGRSMDLGLTYSCLSGQS